MFPSSSLYSSKAFLAYFKLSGVAISVQADISFVREEDMLLGPFFRMWACSCLISFRFLHDLRERITGGCLGGISWWCWVVGGPPSAVVVAVAETRGERKWVVMDIDLI